MNNNDETASFMPWRNMPCGICTERSCDGQHPEIPKFKDKYPISWCKLCESKRIKCPEPECLGTSCNGGGCIKCHEDTIEYNLTLIEERSKIT